MKTSRYLAFAALAAATICQAADSRVERWMRDLTLEEKIDLIGGIGFATHPIPRLGIPSFKMSDGPSGVRTPPPSTAYAAGIGLAASWDTQAAHEVGVQLGRDARSRGAQFLLGPGVNIYRAPMNGRNFEYFGEDPFLGSRIAVGYIEGVQSQGVSTTIKHFTGNNSEYARNTSDSTIDERALREIYLPIFESAVKEAHTGAVMSSYNLTNGRYMTANAYLVDTVLKREWGFDGVFMSDWGATHDALGAANARLDLEMPTPAFMNRATIGPAVRDGRVSMATLDDKVRRILDLGARFGWLDHHDVDLSVPRYNLAGDDVSRKVALSGMVLLKNAQDLLPLDSNKVKNIAVIGPLAHPAVSTAGGSGHVPEFTAVSFLQGVSDELRNRATVTYARGVPTLKVLTAMTEFRTAASGGQPGVIAELFEDADYSGKPLLTHTERQFATGNAGFGGDPDLSALSSLLNDPSKRVYERWTGWYTPAEPGAHTLFVQNSGTYRLLVDDEVVIDCSRIPRAALQQFQISLSAGPHKVVFEQKTMEMFGRPFWRVGLFREGSVIDPLAMQLAAKADAVVLAVGFDADIETEGADREFSLPPGQEELIREISAANPNTVVVITAGGSVDVTPWIDRVRSVVMAWYPGQEGGAAFASLLVGEANFAGRLPISWERAAADNPAHANYYYNDPEHANRIVYREGVFVGYRGYQHANTKPMFPFGFGLSYTTFKYANLKVEPAKNDAQALYSVSFDVTNTGQRPGADVPQVYVGAQSPRVPRPVRELKNFARVQLAPGETKHVTLPLDARAFAYYDVQGKRWRADAGRYAVELGRSVEDIAARVDISLPRGVQAE
jgi:beta-glucosidase